MTNPNSGSCLCQQHYVFSARTTDDGLRRVNELRGRLGVGWDDLVADAVCTCWMCLFEQIGVRVSRPQSFSIRNTLPVGGKGCRLLMWFFELPFDQHPAQSEYDQEIGD